MNLRANEQPLVNGVSTVAVPDIHVQPSWGRCLVARTFTSGVAEQRRASERCLMR